MASLARFPETELELLCLPEFRWKNIEGTATWDHLWSISHKNSLIRRSRFLIGQFLNPARAIKHAASRKADILHFADFNHLTFPLWKRALVQSRIPMVISAHDVRRQKAILNKGWETRQLRAVYQFADAILVHSTVQLEELCNFAGDQRDKIYIVPHGPYEYGDEHRSQAAIREELGVPADIQLALFFGQIRDEKNLNELLEAMAMSRQEIHLLIAGKGGGKHRDVSYYQHKVEALGMAGRVHFVPRFIEDSEIAALFKACDWVALPYSNSFTSQSGVLAIAANYHCPVLASSAPVIGETVKQSGIGVVCNGDDSNALAQGMAEIVKLINEEYRFPFAEYVGKNTWQENAKKTRDVYRKIIGVG